MAEVHNPCRYSIFCHPLHVEIAPFKTVRCTDEQAARVSSAVFVVLTDAEVAERDSTPVEPPVEEVAPRPKRTRAKAKTGTDAPETETRGGDVNWFAGGDLAGVQQTEETKASAAFGTSSGVVGV